MAPLVWLITGTSSGFGYELASQALARGDTVIATSRSVSKLSALKSAGAHTVSLDVTAPEATVTAAVTEAVKPFGRVDILVNNAGYILEGPTEACSDDEVLATFNCNVFGALRMLRAVLPYMRAQRSGTVANIGSIAGWAGGPGAGMYSATKYALAAITESLKDEVAGLGIDVTIIEPGYFRTEFLTSANRTAAGKSIGDYEGFMGEFKGALDGVNLKQPGDPVKGVRVMVEALTRTGAFEGVERLPGRMGLGSDARGYISDCLEKLKVQHERWSPLTSGTDHDDVEKA